MGCILRRLYAEGWVKVQDEEALIVKFGGSATVNEEGLNLGYISQFLGELGVDLKSRFAKVIFVVGGGTRARLALQSGGVQAAIAVTQQHAQQLSAVLRSLGLVCIDYIPKSVQELEQAISTTNFGVAVGGLEIGQTTDAVAMSALDMLDKQGYVVRTVVLSNVNAIYTADPRKNVSAKPVRLAPLSWLVDEGILVDNPAQFKDGMTVPLDPVAVQRYGALLQHQLLFTSANDVNGVRHFLTGVGEQSGTVICEGVDPCFYS